MTRRCYGDFQFDTDHVFALSGNGEKVKFSKLERALLDCFTSQVGKRLNRERLSKCIQGIGSESIDRNVDYPVSRLRRPKTSRHSPLKLARQNGAPMSSANSSKHKGSV